MIVDWTPFTDRLVEVRVGDLVSCPPRSPVIILKTLLANSSTVLQRQAPQSVRNGPEMRWFLGMAADGARRVIQR